MNKLTEKHLEVIKQVYPEDIKSNTMTCYRIYELGIKNYFKERDVPEDVFKMFLVALKDKMMEYKPEHIVRMRRDLFPSSKAQLKKEAQYRNNAKFYEDFEEMTKPRQDKLV